LKEKAICPSRNTHLNAPNLRVVRVVAENSLTGSAWGVYNFLSESVIIGIAAAVVLYSRDKF